jgi:hypothetical protein
MGSEGRNLVTCLVVVVVVSVVVVALVAVRISVREILTVEVATTVGYVE